MAGRLASLEATLPDGLVSKVRAVAFGLRRGVTWLAAKAIRDLVLARARVICLTGSAGKSTTAQLSQAVLAARYPGHLTRRNSTVRIRRNLLAARPWHKFYIQELSAARGSRGPHCSRRAWVR